MTQPFPADPFLTGHHAPVRMEADAPDLVVEGELPRDLAGVFYRNGPEPLYAPVGEAYHWFDGDGMVFGFEIADGRVSMRNRWVRTEKFERERAAGRRLFGVFGNPLTTDESVRGVRYNTANTNVILHGGQLLALMEGAPPVALDPRTLDTLGEEHYGGRITSTFSAHPKIDWATGELVNISIATNAQAGRAELLYSITDATGHMRKTEAVPLPNLSLMHTFFLTESYVVFPVMPIDASLTRAKAGGPLTAWVPDRPSRLGVMPREGTADQTRWFEMDGRHMFHELNMWEEDGKIVADVAAANGTALFPDIHGHRLTHEQARQSIRRWTLDLSANSDTVKEETLNERDIQFPRPDDRLVTRRSRHGFANLTQAGGGSRVAGLESVMRFDTVTGEEDVYSFEPGSAAGELVFAPRLGARGEADGYAMTLVHRANAPNSELAVFDALDIAAGPLARVQVPFRAPSGFHCNYYSADSDLHRRAFDA